MFSVRVTCSIGSLFYSPNWRKAFSSFYLLFCICRDIFSQLQRFIRYFDAVLSWLAANLLRACEREGTAYSICYAVNRKKRRICLCHVMQHPTSNPFTTPRSWGARRRRDGAAMSAAAAAAVVAIVAVVVPTTHIMPLRLTLLLAQLIQWFFWAPFACQCSHFSQRTAVRQLRASIGDDGSYVEADEGTSFFPRKIRCRKEEEWTSTTARSVCLPPGSWRSGATALTVVEVSFCGAFAISSLVLVGSSGDDDDGVLVAFVCEDTLPMVITVFRARSSASAMSLFFRTALRRRQFAAAVVPSLGNCGRYSSVSYSWSDCYCSQESFSPLVVTCFRPFRRPRVRETRCALKSGSWPSDWHIDSAAASIITQGRSHLEDRPRSVSLCRLVRMEDAHQIDKEHSSNQSLLLRITHAVFVRPVLVAKRPYQS